MTPTRRSAVRALLAVAALSLGGCDNSPTEPSVFTTENFSGTVARQAFTSHTFTTQQTSPTIIRMTSFTPQVNMGLAIGVPFGESCQISGQTVVKQGDEFQLQLEPATYCVMVFDVGNVAESTTVSYTMVIQHR